MNVLITGITGFAGSHLAEYILAHHPDVQVHGIIRWRSRMDNVAGILGKVELHEADLKDFVSLKKVLAVCRPERIFHLAAQSFVPTSWRLPAETFMINAVGQINLFEAALDLKLDPRIQIAGSSEEYGMVHPDEVPMKETNPLRPLSPYAVSKVAQDLLGYQYFKSYGLKVIRTRGFNHTGPRRGDVFVTSNFSKQVAEIEKGKREPVIHVGNLDALRDFTDVRDMVRAYWLAAEKGEPGDVYNPLFIYGGSGLGKTHLLQAIGHHKLSSDPSARVLYVTCERFTNDFIQAVRGGRGKEFKEAHRTVDMLLIDDIQFMSGKEATQEEFFHTFNALHQNNKQIVITSDRSPKDIQGLESRLLSRFEWGMIADVSAPDFETRIAILEAKMREKQAQLSSEILRYIAGTVQMNVRELEGALTKIIAYHQFKNITPTLASVQSLLQSFVPNVPKRTITPRRLIEIVVGYYELTLDEILGKSREQRLAYPRQIAMYLLREEAKCSFPAIGTHVGGRDHTTAMHACNKINGLLKEDEQLRRDISLIREKLYAGSASG